MTGPGKRRVVCVSNRITLPRKTAAPGGLAVGILSILEKAGGLWFGWGGELSDGEPADPDIHIRNGVSFATIDLKHSDYTLYYNGYANETLWPLCHYLLRDFKFKAEEHDAYENVNRMFAAKLLPLLQPEDVIWVHDYHLIPMARLLRESGCKQPIGFFLHIPFPHIDMLRVLPTHGEMLRDLATYDVVGFQTESDLRAFRSGVEYLFGNDALRSGNRTVIGNRELVADIFPIGVDVDAIQNAASEARQSEAVVRTVDSLVGRKLMIGVDRLDYSKGLVERFAAYRQFLESFPDNMGRITYIQIAPLSRSDVRAYAEIRNSLEQAAGQTNGQYGDTDWTPIRYLNRNFPHATLMGFLRASHVGLVTPVRDGMNLVAKEYLAAQDEQDPGVLILSNLAGAARELSSAILINPYDARAVGMAIQTALTMPLGERRERHAAMMDVLRHNDIHHWADRFVTTLECANDPHNLKVAGTIY